MTPQELSVAANALRPSPVGDEAIRNEEITRAGSEMVSPLQNSDSSDDEMQNSEEDSDDSKAGKAFTRTL